MRCYEWIFLTVFSSVVAQTFTLSFSDFRSDFNGKIKDQALPAQINAGDNKKFTFSSGEIADLGNVSGDVVLQNNVAATAGSITLTNFAFESLEPAAMFTPQVRFLLDILFQNFEYKGGPQIRMDASLKGSWGFFSDSPDQSATARVNYQISSPNLILSTLVLDASGTPRGNETISESDFSLAISSSNPLQLSLIVDIKLLGTKDDEGTARIFLPDSLVVSYAEIPEPSTTLLISLPLLLLAQRVGRHAARTKTHRAAR